MKPYQFLLTTLASTAALGAAGSVVVPSLADSRSSTTTSFEVADSTAAPSLLAAVPQAAASALSSWPVHLHRMNPALPV
jgi:hypothetical protein